MTALQQKQYDTAQARDMAQMQTRLTILRAALNGISTTATDMATAAAALAAIADADRVHTIHRENTDHLIALEQCGGYLRATTCTPEQITIYDRMVADRWIDRDTSSGAAYIVKDFAAMQREMAKKHL
jgi:hypothetical protein